MERGADRQLDGAADAARLGRLDGQIDGRRGAADDDLSGRIVIGKLNDAARRCFRRDLVDHSLLSTENRCHCALACRNRVLHAVAAQPQQARGIADGQRAGSGKGRIFAKRVTGDEGRHSRKVLAGLLLQYR